MYSAGYPNDSEEEDDDEDDEEGEQDQEDDDEESEEEETPPPSQRRRGTVMRDWERKAIYVDGRGTPCGSLVEAFETELRRLSRDLDPGHNWQEQQPEACEKFMQRLLSGTTILFVAETTKPYYRMQTTSVCAFSLLPITGDVLILHYIQRKTCADIVLDGCPWRRVRMSELMSMETCQETWADVHGDVEGCLQRRLRMRMEKRRM